MNLRLEVKAPFGERLLLYNESRSFFSDMRMGEDWDKLFTQFGVEKFYCEIELKKADEGTYAEFIKRLPEQSW